MPHRSRTTRTGVDSAATSIVPAVCATSGGGGGSRRHPIANAAAQSAARTTTLDGMAIKDGLLAEFDHEIGTTRRLLERLADDRLEWKPHERSMSLGGLATHLSNLPHWGGIILNEASFDLAGAPPPLDALKSRADILTSLDQKAGKARESLDRTDAELLAPWSLKRAGQEVFTMPRVTAFRTFVLYHIVHHRGQLSVYLRLNGIPVPAIYGPSADEG